LRKPFLIVTACILFLGTSALVAAGVWLFSELETPYYRGAGKEVFVDIPRGASAARIADLLADAGVLKRRLPFRVYVRYAGIERSFQAGEYRFSEAASPREIARRLARGDVFYYSVTVPEGLTARETVELLAASGLGNPAGLERALLNTGWIRDLDPSARNLEGYLFPETYRFRRHADPDTIVKAMVDQFRAKIAGALGRDPMPDGWDIPRIVTLASMIEKEVQRREEGPLVASVYVNRLARRMPLGCDATIIYAMKLAGAYRGRLGKADLRMESPYNSYIHPGLPPGPICNPGMDALRAAIKPASSGFYYYVSRNDGTHQFSENYADHVRAVNVFQKPLARRRP